jgi:aminoglycoside phosphotransferase
MNKALEALRYNVTGAIERGESEAIVEKAAGQHAGGVHSDADYKRICGGLASEIKSLRAQLAEREEDIAKLKDSLGVQAVAAEKAYQESLRFANERVERLEEWNARLRLDNDVLLNSLEFAVRYLENPEVQAIPFALPASAAADRARAAIAQATGGAALAETETSNPNARLIASAPALLAALEDVITAAEIIDGQESPPESADVDYLHGAIDKARAAIAQAKGEK